MTRMGKSFQPLPPLNNNQGFTISEMMLSLSIWAILLLTFLPLSHRTYTSLENKWMIKQFQSDVQVAQRMNMEHSPYFFFFLTEEGYYLFDSIDKKVIYERHLPGDWKIRPQTITSPIRFNHEGTIRNPGTIRMVSSQTEYLITFPFGVGGPVIEQQ